MKRDEDSQVLVDPWCQRRGLGGGAIDVSQWSETITVSYRIGFVNGGR